jgi:hypothetical protein
MGYPVAAIQIAIIARLRGDATLPGLLTGAVTPEWSIYDADGIPTNKLFPYIGTFPITNQVGSDLAFGTDAMDTWQQVSVFTKSKGFAQARAIAGRIYGLLDQKGLDLSASGFNQYFLLFNQDQELGDGIYQHIPMRFALRTQG